MVERLLRCLGWVSLRLRGEMAVMLATISDQAAGVRS